MCFVSSSPDTLMRMSDTVIDPSDEYCTGHSLSFLQMLNGRDLMKGSKCNMVSQTVKE